MAVYKDVKEIPRWRRPVVALGTFDGVHKGHQAVIKTAVTAAKKNLGTCVAVTFDHIPREVLKDQQKGVLITPVEDKLHLLEDFGVEHCVVIKFTRSFSKMKPETFVRNILVNRIGVHTLVVGENYHFGADRAGSVDLLERLSGELSFRVKIVPGVYVGDSKVSSTRIREELNRGSISQARALLGHPFFIKGTVIKGSQFGRSIGFPTANIHADERLVLPQGVFAVKVKVGTRTYAGVGNVGFRPTMGSPAHSITVEAHLFGLKKSLYGREICVELVEKIRPERRFKDKAELAEAIRNDARAAQRILG